MARNSAANRGVSLARGPIAVIGALGVVYGIGALIFGDHSFALHFPHGHAHGTRWLQIRENGWTALLFLAAGLLLMLGGVAHWTAKTLSLLVGLALLAAAIIAVIRGHGIFGIFAADHRTEVVWAVAGIVLILLSRLGRVGGGRSRTTAVGSGTTAGAGLAGTGTGSGLTSPRTDDDAQ